MGAETTQHLPGSTSQGAGGSLDLCCGSRISFTLEDYSMLVNVLIACVPLTPWSSRPWGRCPRAGYKAGGGFSAKRANYKSIKQGTQRDRTRKHEISEMPHTAEQVEVSARQNLTITRLNEHFSYFSFCFLLSCNFKTWINFLQHFAFFFCQPGFQITLLQLKMGLIKVIQVWRYWQFAWQTGCG